MNKQDELMEILVRMLSGNESVNINRVEFSETGRSFIAHNAEGGCYGGDLTDNTITVKEAEDKLLKDVESGALGRHFAIYETVPVDVLAAKRDRFTDWRDIFNA